MPRGRLGLIDYGQVSEIWVDNQIDRQMHRQQAGTVAGGRQTGGRDGWMNGVYSSRPGGAPEHGAAA
eukprot:scaffold43934_cov62-Phaeocystis_antarctica.AAC.11